MISQQIPFAAVGIIAAGLLIYGLRAGRMLSSWGWVERDKQPALYWLATAAPVAAIVACVLALTYF